MSIFKESFKRFVKTQLAIREAINTIGNNINTDRFKSNVKKIKIDDNNVREITLDPGSFYQQAQRTCIIRMSSGANINPEGAKELGINSSEYYKPSQLTEDRLARRYVLQGGVATLDKLAKGTIQRDIKYSEHIHQGGYTLSEGTGGSGYEAFQKDENAPSGQPPPTISHGKVEAQRTYTNKEDRTYILGQRSGFTGASPNKIGLTYGDPTIGADPSSDGYGIVPMPGILDAEIRTKTAYGSLREAKVNFACHNQQQLEALELLYMRPGCPVLLEWGWSSYINNSGNARTFDNFPFIAEWYHKGTGTNKENTLTKILNIIKRLKKDQSGNYDAMIGFVKNYNYTARADGGYDCEVELIAQGEIIENLKGTEDVATDSNGNSKLVDTFSMGLELMLNWSSAADLMTNSSGEGSTEKTHVGKITSTWGDSLFNWESGAAAAVSVLAFGYYGLLAFGVYSLAKAWGSVDSVEKLADGQQLYDLFGLSDMHEETLKDRHTGQTIANAGMYKNLLAPSKGAATSTRSDTLKQLVLHTDFKLDNLETNAPYVRWDALATFLNRHVIDRDSFGKPLMHISTNIKVNEESAAKRKIEPLYMCKPPKLNLIEDQFGRSGGDKHTEEAILNMSVDPLVCILPMQTQGGMTDTVSLAGKMFGGIIQTGFGEVSNQEEAEMYDMAIELTEEQSFQVIGHIYFHLPRLLYKYKEARYDSEGNMIEDFNLIDFLNTMWKDVNTATGNLHNFEFNIDHENSNIARVIDLKFQKEKELDVDSIYELKIQSNESICRDFSYNSVIPSSLSSTIAISMQDPDNVKDLDAATFAAFSRHMYSRFHVANPESSKPSPDLIEKKSMGYDKDLNNYIELIGTLYQHYENIKGGDFQTLDSDSGSHTGEGSTAVGKAANALRKLHMLNSKLYNRYSYNHYEQGIYKGFINKKHPAPPISALIPLKFNALLDGISGIVIGHVFKLQPSRLPKMYKKCNIAFIVMGESQNINAGGDWTTEINGQLIMLPKTNNTNLDDEDMKAMKEGANLLISNKKVSNTPSAYTSGNINTARTTQLNQIHRNSQTPWADKLTEVVAGFGYTIKVEGGNQLNEAGDITREMAMTAAAVFGKIKTIYPYSMDIKITGGNDEYHSGMNSRHNHGRAIDFTVNNDTTVYNTTGINLPKEIYDIENLLLGFVAANVNEDGEHVVRFLNEYSRPSGAATAGHFHLSYGTGTEGKDNVSRAISLLEQGLISPHEINYATSAPEWSQEQAEYNDTMSTVSEGIPDPDSPAYGMVVMSDIRMKTNIEKVGNTKYGIPLYEFNYKNNYTNRYRGVMAQDLLKTNMSKAVRIMDNGYYAIDYSQLDINLEKLT